MSSSIKFHLFLIGTTLKISTEAKEVHAMEKASWATFLATSLAQRSGPPVPTMTLPIGTERKDIYACENSRGNQKSSSLGKIQTSY